MADLTLYSVSNEFDYLCDLIDKDALSPEEVEEISRILAEKVQSSAEEIIKFFKTNTAQVEDIKNEIALLQQRKKKAENREQFLKEALTNNMKKLNLKKIETPIGKMLIPNSVTLSVEVVDINKVPEEYKKKKLEISVDKDKVKKHFKETGEILDGVNIVETPSRVQFR